MQPIEPDQGFAPRSSMLAACRAFSADSSRPCSWYIVDCASAPITTSSNAHRNWVTNNSEVRVCGHLPCSARPRSSVSDASNHARPNRPPAGTRVGHEAARMRPERDRSESAYRRMVTCRPDQIPPAASPPLRDNRSSDELSQSHSDDGGSINLSTHAPRGSRGAL